MDREYMLQDRTNQGKNRDEISFITGFNTKYKILKGIIKKELASFMWGSTLRTNPTFQTEIYL